MKTIRQYPKGCDFCNGTGRLNDFNGYRLVFRTCPVCNDTGVIMVTETITDSSDFTSQGMLEPIKLEIQGK